MIPIDVETRVRISPSVYARAFGSELVLLHFGRGEYFGLDEVGAVIWRRLEQGDTLGMVADALVERFAVAREDAIRDIIAVVAEMRNEALLEI
jgi:hypothetical protein